jgi:hypothetical protein
VNPISLVVVILLLGQTSGEQFFEEVTPGLGGIFVPTNSYYLTHKKFSVSFRVVLSPYKIFPYTTRAAHPALLGECDVGLFDRWAVVLKAGIYPENETDQSINPWGVGIQYTILNNEKQEHLSVLVSYHQLGDVQFHPRDPNFTARYDRLAGGLASIVVNKKLVGFLFGLKLGYQYCLIDGSYGQEAIGTVTEYSEGMGYVIGHARVERRFSKLGIGIGLSVSKNLPVYSAYLSFVP